MSELDTGTTRESAEIVFDMIPQPESGSEKVSTVIPQAEDGKAQDEQPGRVSVQAEEGDTGGERTTITINGSLITIRGTGITVHGSSISVIGSVTVQGPGAIVTNNNYTISHPHRSSLTPTSPLPSPSPSPATNPPAAPRLSAAPTFSANTAPNTTQNSNTGERYSNTMACSLHTSSSSRAPDVSDAFIAQIEYLHRKLGAMHDLRPRDEVKQLFQNLVEMCCRVYPTEIVEKILASPVIIGLTPELRELCAEGEGELEGWWVEYICAARDRDEAHARLLQFPYHSNYTTLTTLELSTLHLSTTLSKPTHPLLPIPPTRIAFIGCGSLPLTSLCLLSALSPSAAYPGGGGSNGDSGSGNRRVSSSGRTERGVTGSISMPRIHSRVSSLGKISREGSHASTSSSTPTSTSTSSNTRTSTHAQRPTSGTSSGSTSASGSASNRKDRSSKLAIKESHAHAQVHVLNIDADEKAIVAARKLVARLGVRGMGFLVKRVGDDDERVDVEREKSVFEGLQVVVLAALVGDSQEEKEGILLQVVSQMDEGAFVIIRSAHGTRSLLYPTFDVFTEAILDVMDICHVVHPFGSVVNSVIIAKVRVRE